MPLQPSQSARDQCMHFLSYDPPVSAQQWLTKLAEYAGDAQVDQAGTGELIEQLEERICKLLGKPAAVFMPAGKAAQNIAIRLWCDRRNTRRIAIHPQSHMQEWEDLAYAHVFGLEAVPFGAEGRQVRASDVNTSMPTSASLSSSLPCDP